MDFNVTHDNVQYVVQIALLFGGLWLVAKFKTIEKEKEKEETKRKKADERLTEDLEKSSDRLYKEIEKKLNSIEGKTADQYRKIQNTEDTVCHMSTHIAEDYVLKKDLPYIVKGITNDQ